MSFGKRLVFFREHKLKINQKEMADKMGILPQTLVRYEKDKIKPSYEFIEKLTNLFTKDIQWLLTGVENAFTNQIVNQDINTYTIDILSLKASAGIGIINYEVDVVGNMSLDKGFFPTFQKMENLKIIDVIGDSMEPTIKNGAKVVIDITKKTKANGVYAINYDGEIYIKRLQYRMDGTINIISDNRFYPIENYNSKESDLFFDVIGMKVLIIQD